MRYGRPHSILDTVPSEIAPQYRLEPSPLALVSARVQYRPEERWQWAVLRKITYGVGDDGVLYRVDQQEPVHRACVPHAPLPDWLGHAAGREGSMKTVPEARVTQSGTDVVIRGHAASARPVREMLAGVVIGKHAHKLRVSGERLTRVERGRVAFSEPQWFERVPLRYELAYGGVDAVALQLALKLARQRLGDLEFRRASAFLKDTLPAVAPLCYARNPVGTGYVADAVAEALHDVALPRIELECDPLNPERFGAGNPLQWLARPVPAGMDFMDVPMFPRTAMMGLPPLGYPVQTCEGVIEVEWGQLPEDFSRGNVVSAPDERVPDIPHPDRWRVAPIGLRLPWLVGTETVSLVGMRADLPRWDICLPAERPVFALPDQPQEPARMWQLFIDADARRAEILWGRSWFMDRELMPGEDREWLKRIALRGERLT